MPTPNASAGLLTLSPDEFDGVSSQVPLTGVQIQARICGTAARVRVVQSYENRETVPLESVYVFPLEERSAVSGFAVTIDGRRHEGRVKSRDEAFDNYDDAMAEGHGAFLLDQERPNVFTASVGNLLPGQKVDVEIDYVAELDRVDDGIRLMIPTTVSPRYVPEHRRDFEGMTDGERVNPPVALDPPPYRLKLSVEADLLSAVRGVESPSHKIRFELDGNLVRAELAGDEGCLDRDFVLLLTPAETWRPLSCQTTGRNGERFVMASFRPEIEAERSPVEVAFLIDCSGSMHGPSIDEARRTLRLCLHSLSPGDRFNIVRFGSSHESLFAKSRAYDDTSLKKAEKYVAGMEADLGGTEILAPLRELVASEPADAMPRRIVLLTDGQVANEDDVLTLARQHRDTTRIFAFGIGHGASEFLVRGVARASNGASEFVYPGERIEDKVMRHFKRLTLPAASGARLEWDGLEVADVLPPTVPSFGPGDTVTFLARVTGGESGSVRLTGEIGGRSISTTAEIGPATGESELADVLPLLWAWRRIRELEEGAGWTSRAGSRQFGRKRTKAERERKKVEAELVQLGETYGLTSQATSFVVVEHRAESERSTERAELRQIPVALTRGWGGLAAPGFPARMARRSMQTVDMMGVDEFSELACEERIGVGGGPERLRQLRSIAMGPPHPASVAETAAPDEDPWLQLLLTQNADGSWEITDDLVERCGCERSVLEDVAARSTRADAAKILATLTVLRLVETVEVKDAWQPILDKGREWVESALGSAPAPEPHATWDDWARQIVA